MKIFLNYLRMLAQFAQIYFFVLGFFVFVTIIDPVFDLKRQVSTKNLLFYIVLAALIFLSRIVRQNKSQNANA